MSLPPEDGPGLIAEAVAELEADRAALLRVVEEAGAGRATPEAAEQARERLGRVDERLRALRGAGPA